MLSGKRSLVVLGLFVLAAASFAYISSGASAQGQGKKQKTITIPSTGHAPKLDVTADPTYVTACTGETGGASSRVRLVANATPGGVGLRYKWSAPVGTISPDNDPNATWDLTGVPPGTYRAQVDVDSGRVEDCAAFMTTTVTVVPCPPVACPSIILSCPDPTATSSTVTFTATVSGVPANITPVYNWSVSAGTIVNGQGTRTIQVETGGMAGQAIRATLDVGGFNLTCAATCTVQVPLLPLYPTKFDEFPNIKFDDEKARLDNYAIQLQSDPRSQGYIIIYPGARDRQGDAQRRTSRARDYLINTRGIDAGRIFVLTGGPRPEQTIELWLVPNGAAPPTPKP
jgi:hypothetical protein